MYHEIYTIDSRGKGLETQGFHAAHACRTGNRQEIDRKLI